MRLARQIFFSGKVQGVGFRARAQKLAQNHQVSGYVKNLEDGRVELWIEGEESELDRYEHSLEHAMHNYIEDIDSNDVDAKDLDGFEINH